MKESFLQLPFKQHILQGSKKILSMLVYYLEFEDLYKKHYLLVKIMYFCAVIYEIQVSNYGVCLQANIMQDRVQNL